MLIVVLKNKFIVLFVLIFGTLLFPIGTVAQRQPQLKGMTGSSFYGRNEYSYI